MNTLHYWRYIARIFYVIACLAGIILFLKIPHVLNLFSTDRSISVLAWPSNVDGEFLVKFEQETGIKVYLSYFENYEELIVKLKSGNSGYDIIMPADYAADLFIKEGLLKKIDKSKLTFWRGLHETLLGKYYDKDDEYTIPYGWGIYGIGVNTSYFDGNVPDNTWGLLFDQKHVRGKVAMIDDAREVALVAAQYLFKDAAFIDDNRLQQIKELLLKQKNWVGVFTDVRVDYLLTSGSVSAAMVNHADLCRALRERDDIAFVVPREGSFIMIDLVAIPATSEKQELVYSFLNYLYQPENLSEYALKFGFFPAIKAAQTPVCLPGLDTPTKELLEKLHFFKNVIPERLLNDLWITLKS